MAIAVVQGVYNQALSTSVSVTPTLTAGNAALVYVCTVNSAVPVQTAGDTLTLDRTLNDTGDYLRLYSDFAVAGGATTFTFTTSSGAICIFVTEVSGLATSSAFDQSADTARTTNTTHSSGTTPTTTQADEIVLAGFHLDGSGSTVFTSLTNSFTPTVTPTTLTMGAGLNQRGLVAYRIVAATGTYETTMTSDNSIGMGMIGTYKAAGGGGGDTSTTQQRMVAAQSLIENSVQIGQRWV